MRLGSVPWLGAIVMLQYASGGRQGGGWAQVGGPAARCSQATATRRWHTVGGGGRPHSRLCCAPALRHRAPPCRQPAGGRFRGGLGKLLFRTTLLAQSVLQPDVVTNKVGGAAPQWCRQHGAMGKRGNHAGQLRGIPAQHPLKRGRHAPLGQRSCAQLSLCVPFHRPLGSLRWRSACWG